MKEIFFSDRTDREIRCCMLLMEFMLLLLEYRKELTPDIADDDRYGYTDDIMRRMISVTDYIKNNLTADDLSQGAMAEKAGISRSFLSTIEAPSLVQSFSIDILYNLSDALDIDPGDLINGDIYKDL